MEFPRGVEREYIAAIDIAAVFIAIGKGDGVLRASRDLEASERTLREADPSLRIVGAWWVRGREAAEEIARRAKRALQPSATTDQAYAAIVTASSGVKLTEHATVLKRVAAAARRVDDALKVANGRGELTWFNRAYREYRLRGGRSMSYGEARGRLRRAMMRRLVLVERVEYGADMLVEVFGATF